MSSLQSVKSYNSSSSFDEDQWVIQICFTLDNELEEDTEIPVSIFNVPKALMASDPNSYIPQLVAFGPYHFLRPELSDMERYKLAAANRTQKHLKNLKFQHLVDQLMKHEQRIRACYHKYLDFNGETLAWMMAVDAAFLLEFLQISVIKEGKILSRMSHLVNMEGTKSAQNAILRDMVMVENQIPLFSLRKMLEMQHSSIESADNALYDMLMGLFKELSPFNLMEEHPNVQVSKRAHLLEFLYHLIVPIPKGSSEFISEEVEEQNEAKEVEENSLENSNYIKQFFDEFWKLFPKLHLGFIQKPLTVVLKLPLTIISTLPIPGIRVLNRTVEQFSIPGANKEEVKPGGEINNKPTLGEEISVPSVTELFKAGVKFSPTNGGLLTISFDFKTSTLYLPTISLDVNTEVILRNLVAYESCNASGPLVLTRYTELMNGIIDTREDARLLRKRGIVFSRLKSDDEVANLWNGMSRSVRLTKVDFLDKVIADVNKYYNSRWKVKAGKFVKVYVFRSWQLLSLLAVVMLLVLESMQAFCSVYSCPRILGNIR